MTIDLAKAIQALAPNARSTYLQCFASATETTAILEQYGINSLLRRAHFFSQALHETDGFTVLRESLHYTHGERLMEVWPSRFPTTEMATPFLRDSQKLANHVYGGRMGNDGPNDGYLYRGGGMLQLTGKEAYARIGARVGADLVARPELTVDPQYSLAIAAAEWQGSDCNALADRDDIKAVTKAVNGGQIGLANRKAWLAKTRAIWD